MIPTQNQQFPQQSTDPARKVKDNTKRCYFGNIPFTTSDDDLKTVFAPCGEIGDLYVVRDKFTKKSQGYGFVEFKEVSARDEALKLNGTMQFGRAMKVNTVTKKEGSCRLFVKGIPPSKTEDDVKNLFTQYGAVSNVFFIKDKVTKVSRGFGFVDFENQEAADSALQLDGSSEFGGTIKVSPAKPQQPKPQMGMGGYGGAQPGMGGFSQPYSPYGAPQQQMGYGGYQAMGNYGANVYGAQMGWQGGAPQQQQMGGAYGAGAYGAQAGAGRGGMNYHQQQAGGRGRGRGNGFQQGNRGRGAAAGGYPRMF